MSADPKLSVASGFEEIFTILTNGLESLLFYPIPFPGAPDGFPFLVLWLVLGGIYFTIYLQGANFRLIGHAIAVVSGKYKHEDSDGEVSPLQALTAAVSGTVGLGNIAGVAVGITLGGPGAVIWMMVAAIFGTATKLAEVTIGHMYREVDEHGHYSGGAFHYLTSGLKERGMETFGKVLAVIFCFCCIGGALGGGNMLQSNQSVSILVDSFPFLQPFKWMIALSIAVGVGIVLIGGIKRIVQVTERLVPFMAAIYVTACIVVLVANASLVPDAFATMLHHAFTPEAAGGGMIGAIIMGFRRAFFSNEAGVGSAPMVHAASTTKDPVREGCVALLEPIIDTVIICTMTGLVIVVTGVYALPDVGTGVVMTAAAFKTVIDWFPEVLAICVFLFAFSTMITWSYYGERAWHYLFGPKWVNLYYVIFATLAFFGGLINLGVIVDFGDLILLAMAIPDHSGGNHPIGLFPRSTHLRRIFVTKPLFQRFKQRLTNGRVMRFLHAVTHMLDGQIFNHRNNGIWFFHPPDHHHQRCHQLMLLLGHVIREHATQGRV